MSKLVRQAVIGSGYGEQADAEQLGPEPAAPAVAPERSGEPAAAATEVEPAPPVVQVTPAAGSPSPVAEVTPAAVVPAVARDVARSVQPGQRRDSGRELLERFSGRAGVGWAWREVERSTLSARQRVRGAWVLTPVRFSQAVHELLTGRLVDDQERTGDFRLSFNHYVSAALRQVPADVGQAAVWAQLYQDYLGMRSPASVGTKMSLEASVAEAMPRLQAQLRRRYRFGLVGHVQTWAVVGLLADLDAADAGEPDDVAARLRVLERLDAAMG